MIAVSIWAIHHVSGIHSLDPEEPDQVMPIRGIARRRRSRHLGVARSVLAHSFRSAGRHSPRIVTTWIGWHCSACWGLRRQSPLPVRLPNGPRSASREGLLRYLSDQCRLRLDTKNESVPRATEATARARFVTCADEDGCRCRAECSISRRRQPRESASPPSSWTRHGRRWHA